MSKASKKKSKKSKKKERKRGMKTVVLTVYHAQQQKMMQTGPVIAKRQKNVKLLGCLGGGAHKHFFDRDARPRTNFNYPKK